MSADPAVMRFFPKTLTRGESDAVADRIEQHFAEHGFGMWALEVPGEVPFAGFVGLLVVSFDAHFTPAIEVGWRLAAEQWGNGYATEAARAAVEWGFRTLDVDEIVAMAVESNVRSTAVMERLGMTRNPDDDFDHPKLEETSPIRRHVLYRLRRPE